MRSVKRHRQPLIAMADINVTNLIDTAFVLLITFMLVAPQLTHGVKIDLPNVADAPTMTNETTKTLVITVAKKREGEDSEWIYVKYKTEERVAIEDLTARIVAAHEEKPDLSVIVEGDENSTYGTFLQVVAAVKAAGVDNIGMPAEPLTAPKAGKDKDEKDR